MEIACVLCLGSAIYLLTGAGFVLAHKRISTSAGRWRTPQPGGVGISPAEGRWQAEAEAEAEVEADAGGWMGDG